MTVTLDNVYEMYVALLVISENNIRNNETPCVKWQSKGI